MVAAFGEICANLRARLASGALAGSALILSTFERNGDEDDLVGCQAQLSTTGAQSSGCVAAAIMLLESERVFPPSAPFRFESKPASS